MSHRQSPKRVLVYGATGVQGRPVVERLLAAGHHVRVLTRDRSKAADLERLGAEIAVGDVHCLLERTRRFAELRRLVHGVTAHMLTAQLRELERDGIVHREVFAEVPPRVEYSLTARGEALRPVLEAMVSWGTDYLEKKSSP